MFIVAVAAILSASIFAPASASASATVATREVSTPSRNAASGAAYDLRQITDRQALMALVGALCAREFPERGLLRALRPPPAVVVEGDYCCRERPSKPVDSARVAPLVSAGLLSREDEDWLHRSYRLLQMGNRAPLSERKRLDDPRDISFLHRAFATRPYLSAHIMASASAPLVGEVWLPLAAHMDRILQASEENEDRRLLAFAMARDGREFEALTLLEQQLQKGDALALQVLPYVALDMPAPIADEMADTSAPALGYRLVPMLENYLIQQQYPESFCGWAQILEPGPLRYYVNTVLVNFEEMMPCAGVREP